MNLLPTLTAPRPLIFLSNLSNADEVALVANVGKTSSPKGTARSNSAPLSNSPITLPEVLPRNLPY